MKIVPSKCQVPKASETEEAEHCDIVNKLLTFHTSTIYWGNRGGWSPVDLYFVPMPVRTALPPNANSGLSWLELAL